MRPDVTSLTERLYEQMPQAYQDADEGLDWPLLRYLSLLGDQAAEVEALADRIGDLGNPQAADEAWLPWLAQLVGATPLPLSGQAARDAIAGASNGYLAGTKGAIAAAARSSLTGTRHVEVYDHSANSPGDGGQWDVLLVTKSSETPDASAVLAAVTSKHAKPAGVVLHHRAYSATWMTLATAYPTWASRAGKTWTDLGETGL